MSSPIASVVLPFRNAASTLAEAIESIRQQTYPQFECLLIDNGSKDTSAAIAREAARRDRRFRLLQCDGNLVSALNKGVSEARSSLIARMDADDRSHPARLERQIALLASNPSLSLVSCLVSCFSDEGIRSGMRRYEQWLNGLLDHEQIRNALFIESPVAHPSVLIKRDALLAAGGYRDTGGPEDYDLWFRLLLSSHRAAKVPEVLFEWRDQPRRLSRADDRYQSDKFFETKLRYLPRVVPPTRPLQIWGAGPTGRRWARALKAQGYRIRRFIDIDARKIGRDVYGIPVDAPDWLSINDGFILAAVGSPGAREQIEAELRKAGLWPWRDYLAVA